jgi:hypothetical protein
MVTLPIPCKEGCHDTIYWKRTGVKGTEKSLLKKQTSSLVVIRGRRRIGKSRLAEEFSQSFPKSYFLTGIAPVHGMTKQD